MSEISRVLVQKERGEFSTRNTFVAYLGFEQKGYETEFFDIESLQNGGVTITPQTMIVGGIGAVKAGLNRFNIELPTPLDYPTCLTSYLGRRIWKSTWGEIRNLHAKPGGSPVFVKPATGLKSFAGTVVAQFRDLIPTAHFPNETELMASTVVSFQSEWRYFVHHHEVVGVGHYSGDPLLFPNPDTVRSAVDAFRQEAPVAYGIDFGVIAEGQTLLVEANDGYSLGSYGMPPVRYATMLEDRWVEMTQGLR